MSDETYSIIRFHRGDMTNSVMATGLTLEEAHEWCRNPETSSRTCTLRENVEYTKKHGEWFDGYTEE